MKKMISMMTVSLLTATTVATASPSDTMEFGTLNKSDSHMLFGQSNQNIIALGQDEMQKTEGDQLKEEVGGDFLGNEKIKMYILLAEVAFIGYLLGNIKFLKKYEFFIVLGTIIIGLIDSESIFFYYFDLVFFIYLMYLTIRTIKIKKETNSIKLFLFLIIILIIFNQIYDFYN